MIAAGADLKIYIATRPIDFPTRLVTGANEAASPKPVMGGRDVFLWRRPRVIEIRRA